MMSSRIDLNPLPGDSGPGKTSAGWSLDGELQVYKIQPAQTEVVSEYAPDSYDIATSRPNKDPSWVDQSLHTFTALAEAKAIGKDIDSVGFKVTGPPAYEGSDHTLVDQDTVLDRLEAGEYGSKLPGLFLQEPGRPLPYDLAFVQGIERPVLFPDGEITMMPRIGNNFKWSLSPNHPLYSETYVDLAESPVCKGGARPDEARTD